ncbi:MAG: hypothetical protein KAJ19_18890 [Gammaproteobacteria bacterium]|nr:hypothetical protein [Gammaproteobacteria bacterium]
MNRSPKHLRLIAALRRPAIHTAAARERFNKFYGELTVAVRGFQAPSTKQVMEDAKVLGAILLFAAISVLAAWPVLFIGGM